MEKYRQVRVLGEGSFGQAWLVTHQSTSESLVIKTISIPAMTARDKQAAINEVKILSTLRHKNIILYKDAFVDQKNLCLVMEYADDGDLSEKIKNQNGRLFLEMQIIDWFVQILIAVKYIHSLNILHRDLKSQNIFLTKSGFVKIGDFGVSKYLDEGLQQAKTTIGTPFYLSPEICQQKPYDHRSDMWSLGVLTYELTTLKHPFVANEFSNLVVKIINGKYPPISSCYGPLLQDLILVLLQVNPDDRPPASHLLKAPSLQTHVRSYLLRVKNAAPYDSHKNTRNQAIIPSVADYKPKRSSLDSLDTSGSAPSANSSGISDYNSRSVTAHPTAGSENEEQNLKSIAQSEVAESKVCRSNGSTKNERNKESTNVNERQQKRTKTFTKLPSQNSCQTDSDSKKLHLELKNKKSHKIITETLQNNNSTKPNTEVDVGVTKKEEKRRTSLGAFRKIMEKPKEKFSRRSSTGSISNKAEKPKNCGKPKNNEKINNGGKPENNHASANSGKPSKSVNTKISEKTPNDGNLENEFVIIDATSSPKKRQTLMCKRPERPAATAPGKNRWSPQPKNKINFIERNKKLHAANKSSPVRSKNTRNQPTQPPQQHAFAKQQQLNTPSLKNRLYEEHTAVSSKAVQEKQAIKLTSTYTKLPKDNTKNPAAKKKRTPSATEAPNVNSIAAYALKERSVTFDNKKSFLKKFSSSIFQATKKDGKEQQNNVEEDESRDTFPIVERSNSDLVKSSLGSRKIRHHSVAFPEGFQVADKVKKRILGRLRAVSHGCDEFEGREVDVIEKQQERTTKAIQDNHEKGKTYTTGTTRELTREHSKTYTVLSPGNVLRDSLEHKLGREKLQKAMGIVNETNIPKEDALKLREAWKIVKGEGETNVLLSLVELKFYEAESTKL